MCKLLCNNELTPDKSLVLRKSQMKRILTNLYCTIADNSTVISVFVLLFLTFIVLMSKWGHGGDMWCWGQWTKYIFTHGLGNSYKSGTNYLPLYQYGMFLFGKFQGSLESIDRNLFQLKVITLLFDFTSGYFLYKILRTRFDKEKSIFYSFFYFFNIAYFYNTLIWCQVDGIMACFVFLAFYYAIKQKVLVSLIFFLLSINLKLQSIVFFPFVGLLLLPSMVNQFSFKKLLFWTGTLVTIQFLILFPFIMAGDLERVWYIVINSVDTFPVVSMNAYNFWYWVVRGDLMHIEDSVRFLGITYKYWGLLMFFATSFLAMFPLLRSVISQLFCLKKRYLTMDQTLIIATLIPILFFFFNTQMHERYTHPAILFLTIYAILSKKYFAYVMGSLAYFMNLEGVLHYLQLKNYQTALFHPAFIAFLFFVCITTLFFQLYGIKMFQKPPLHSNNLS